MKSTFIFAFLIITLSYSFAQTRSVVVNNMTGNDNLKCNTYAIIIGISKYKNIPPLQYADKDAIAFYNYLVSDNGMDADSNNVAICLNEEANINNLGNKVSDILRKDIKKGDRVIFFFAGHGDYDAKIMKDQSLLLLYGASNGNYFQNVFSGDYISTSDLHIKFTSELIKRGANVILIIDACHSGGMNSPLAGGEQGGIVTANALNTIQSTIKLYSCQASQYSLESKQFGGGRGLFSYVLMEGLYGMADSNGDSIISIKEIQRYLEDNVPKLALPNKQDPVIKTEDNTIAICKVNGKLLADYKNINDKSLPFLAEASNKGNEDSWLSNMDTTMKGLYKTCKKQIENKNLENAYVNYKQYELLDSISDASIFLRRNLSAALQQQTSNILTPMLEDVSKSEARSWEVKQAEIDLNKASELLGRDHFLYKKLQARRLFLKVLYIVLKGDENKNLKQCIEDLNESISLEPNAPYAYFYLSSLLYETNNIQEAENNIKKYLDLIPTSPWAHNNYGIIQMKLNRFEEAEKEYKKAIELDKDDGTAYLNYGIVFYSLYRNEEAEKYIKKAIEIEPNSGYAHNNYGFLLDDLNRYEEAEKEYKKAIELLPKYALPHNSYAGLLSNLKRYKEAEEQYKIAIRLKPNYYDAHYNYGIFLYKLHRYSEAKYEFEVAIKYFQYDSVTHYDYCILLNRLKNYSSNIIDLRRTLELVPSLQNAYYYLTCINSIQGELNTALFYFNLSLQKGMGNINIWEFDSDLDNIRTLQEFKKLLLNYFTQGKLENYPNLFLIQGRN